MADAKLEQTAVNVSGTTLDSGMKLTSASSTDVHALLAMRTRHGNDSPIGNRCMNLVQKMKAHAECRDPVRAAEIEKNMRREIAEIAELQRR